MSAPSSVERLRAARFGLPALFDKDACVRINKIGVGKFHKQYFADKGLSFGRCVKLLGPTGAQMFKKRAKVWMSLVAGRQENFRKLHFTTLSHLTKSQSPPEIIHANPWMW